VGDELPAGGAWGSTLTSGEFAAIRSVGFEPVGQVFGAAVFGIAYGVGYGCPGITASSRPVVEGRPSGSALERANQGTEADDLGPLGPLVRAMDQARLTAVERMVAQCAALGGDGVVGLRVSRGSFLLGGQEFTALGTAVRARGAAVFTAAGNQPGAPGSGYGPERAERGSRPGGVADGGLRGRRGRRTPFTCDLSGQDFAKLIMGGWVPVGLTLGVAIGACHDDWPTIRQTRRWSGNREVAGWTEVVNRSRRDAERRLRADVQRLGGEGAVIAGMQLRVSVRDCPAQPGRRDHIIDASVLGTAVARFARADTDANADTTASPALAVLPLAPRSGRGRDFGGFRPA
jgi:uncharacterized protein YbjQ (UPF0145 family)